MRLDNQLSGVTENVLKTPKRALPTFSESLKGVVTENFSGGFAPRPPRSFVNGPPQTSMLDPPLSVTLTVNSCRTKRHHKIMEKRGSKSLNIFSF